MSTHLQALCPECHEAVEQPDNLDRRDFLRSVGGQTASLLAVGALASTPFVARAEVPAARAQRPAEELIRELYRTLSEDQKGKVVYSWNHGADKGRTPTRKGMYNRPIGRAIGDVYTPSQQELIARILRSIAADEDGYRQITRNGTFDGSRSLQACGANIFGDPAADGPFAWVFTGHHLTVRCDGNSEPDAAFGGPIYYGHSPDGYSQRNIFYYQTRRALAVFDSLTEAQRRQAVVVGSPGELEPSIRFRPAGQPHPGIAAAELTAEQRQLVEAVMRDIVSPFRREDADEVMEIVRRNGGLDRLHLAFYKERPAQDNSHWHFWRLEGPGFVWNYRVLPHVHTYVNIASGRQA